MATITFQDVSKRYGAVEAVKNLNLEVKDKEFLTLVGPSGCGKSTILSIVAGLEDPSGGFVYIDGHMVNDVPPGARDIAMVFQSYALYPHMTVKDNIGFGLKVRKMPKAEIDRAVKEAATLLGIADLLDRRPRELSGGQRQRVALGRAITRHPKVFLLDEPLSNLDAKLRIQMRADLKILFQRLQGTVIYVTHDQAEAMTLSDRVVVLNHGVVQQVGTPLEVYNTPRNTFVAGFLGSPSINFADCQLEDAGGDAFVLKGAGFSWQLSSERSGILRRKKLTSREVILGIRPEDITVRTQAMGSSASGIPAKVEVVEHMGSMNILYAATGEQRWVATTESALDVAAGTLIFLELSDQRLHVFDRQSTENVSLAV